MKKFILSTLLFLCFLIVKAQYSTDKFAVNFAIRNMPKYYVPEQNRNFSVVFNAPRQVKRCFETSEELETFFSPMGWSLNRENPYLEIFIEADYLVIDRIYEIEEVEEIKDKGEVLQRKFYRPAMDYHIPIAITARSPQGAVTIENVTDKIPHEPIIYTFVVSERFRSPRHAHDFFLDNGGDLDTMPPVGAQVAQSVEQGTENPRVGSSILSLGTTFPDDFPDSV